MKRTLLAFLIAPIAPFVISLAVGRIGVFIILIGAPIAYATAFLGGIPLFLMLKMRPHLQKGSAYTAFGGLFGFVAALLFSGVLNNDSAILGGLGLLMLWFGLHGLSSGYIFWLIFRRNIRTKLLDSEETISHA